MLEDAYYHRIPKRSSMSYIDNVLSLSPYVFWPLQDASGNPTERVGSGPTLVQYGGITYRVTGPTINGESTYGIQVNNGGDYMYGSGTGYLNGSTSGFTVSGWCKAATSSSALSPFKSYTTTQGTWWINKTTGNALRGATLDSADLSHGEATTSATWPNDTWVWYALRYDTTTLRVYLDTATADDTSFSGTWKRDGTPLTYVGDPSVAASSHAFLAFWTTPLSDSDMTKLRTGVF